MLGSTSKPSGDEYSTELKIKYNRLGLLRLNVLRVLNLLFCFGRMAEVDWIPDVIRPWPQNARTLCRPCRSYPWKTSSCASWWHRNDSAPPAQLVSMRTWRPQAGCKMWFVNSWAMAWSRDVQCRPWHVMNGKGSSASVSYLTPLWCAVLSQLSLWHLWPLFYYEPRIN